MGPLCDTSSAAMPRGPYAGVGCLPAAAAGILIERAWLPRGSSAQTRTAPGDSKVPDHSYYTWYCRQPWRRPATGASLGGGCVASRAFLPKEQQTTPLSADTLLHAALAHHPEPAVRHLEAVWTAPATTVTTATPPARRDVCGRETCAANQRANCP